MLRRYRRLTSSILPGRVRSPSNFGIRVEIASQLFYLPADLCRRRYEKPNQCHEEHGTPRTGDEGQGRLDGLTLRRDFTVQLQARGLCLRAVLFAGADSVDEAAMAILNIRGFRVSPLGSSRQREGRNLRAKSSAYPHVGDCKPYESASNLCAEIRLNRRWLAGVEHFAGAA